MYGMELKDRIDRFISDLPVIESDRHVYIWGTGNTASLYQEGLDREKDLSVFGYADNNEQKWGGVFAGKRIHSPRDVMNDSSACALICSPQPSVVEAVRKQLSDMGLLFYHIDAVIWGLHKDELKKTFDLLFDDESREVLLEIMDSRVRGKYPDERFVSINPYAPRAEFCELDKNEIIVDCGAFVGDTMERFIWQRFGVFKKIIMIEPDHKNVRAIEFRQKRLVNEWGLDKDSLQVLPFAVSDKSNRAIVKNGDGNADLGTRIEVSKIDDTDENSIEVVALDDVIIEPITYLKADIEGFEYRMIRGAERIIKTYRPKLGICIYHNAVDFYSIPLLIKEINPDYKLIIRHYTPQLYDTVLYAW